MRKNCLVAQSGGPTTVINSSLYGVISEFLLKQPSGKVYGGLYGIEGIIKDKVIDLSYYNEETFKELRNMPSSALGSCRYKLPSIEANSSDYERLIEIFNKYEIGYFFYIGGNDSMDAVSKINDYVKKIGLDIKVIGVPKTIDNDLINTDHTPGFASTAKYLCNTALELWFDINCYDKESVMIMEVMGRDTGWIAGSTGILKELVPGINQLIYLPELSFEKERFIKDVKESLKKNNKLLIVTSEGLKGSNGEYINVDDNCYEVDSFGHKQLGGVGKYLQNIIKEYVTKNVKLQEAGVVQRCAMHCSSKTDLDEAEMVGRYGVISALKGKSGFMVSIERNSDNNEEYKSVATLVEVSEVCNKVKYVPLDWIDNENSNVTEKMRDYIRPLILENEEVLSEDGLLKCKNVYRFRIEN
ncbi:6-phosphofructokinase [Clostridium amazonitimonense]|uniref:6-phosphofructokinase n=1 Tax=Clostridium amazonitimonense TaxID=1499689 RepID=UPI000509AC82|nr:6-phosphofructokinase [Clostridium amazonitimonense]